MFKKINKTIYIEGMKCEGCVNRVKNVLSAIPGVKSCSVSLEDKKADLVLTKDIDDSVFQDKIEALGFTLEQFFGIIITICYIREILLWI